MNNKDTGKIKSPLERLFEKEIGGGVEGRAGSDLKENVVHLEGGIYAILRI